MAAVVVAKQWQHLGRRGGGGGRHYQDWPDTGSVTWSPIEMGSCQAMAATVGVIVGRVVAKQWQHLCGRCVLHGEHQFNHGIGQAYMQFQALQGDSVLHQWNSQCGGRGRGRVVSACMVCVA